MPRSHGRISTGIWSDPEFTALREAEQRAYLLAVSQPSISYAGVVSYTLRRWEGLASDSSIARLRKTFLALQAKRYVLIDEGTEELFVRTFIKNDGVLANPNVAKASRAAFAGVHSPLIRGAFLVELHRLNADPRPDPRWEKGWAELQDVLAEPFPKDFPNPLLDPFPEWLEYARAAPVLSPPPCLTAPCEHGAASPSGCAVCRSQTNANGIALVRTALGGNS